MWYLCEQTADRRTPAPRYWLGGVANIRGRTIGRKQVDIRLKASSVSRNHARLLVQKAPFFAHPHPHRRTTTVSIIDSSAYGTFLKYPAAHHNPTVSSPLPPGQHTRLNKDQPTQILHGAQLSFGAPAAWWTLQSHPLLVIPSRLSQPQRTRLAAVAAATGLEVTDQWLSNLTHLVTNRCIPTSSKFLGALAMRIPVVTPAWLEAVHTVVTTQCLLATDALTPQAADLATQLPETHPYIPPFDDEADSIYGHSILSRVFNAEVVARRQSLFDKVRFVFRQQACHSRWTKVMQACGATSTTKMSEDGGEEAEERVVVIDSHHSKNAGHFTESHIVVALLAADLSVFDNKVPSNLILASALARCSRHQRGRGVGNVEQDEWEETAAGIVCSSEESSEEAEVVGTEAGSGSGKSTEKRRSSRRLSKRSRAQWRAEQAGSTKEGGTDGEGEGKEKEKGKDEENGDGGGDGEGRASKKSKRMSDLLTAVGKAYTAELDASWREQEQTAEERLGGPFRRVVTSRDLPRRRTFPRDAFLVQVARGQRVVREAIRENGVVAQIEQVGNAQDAVVVVENNVDHVVQEVEARADAHARIVEESNNSVAPVVVAVDDHAVEIEPRQNQVEDEEKDDVVQAVQTAAVTVGTAARTAGRGWRGRVQQQVQVQVETTQQQDQDHDQDQDQDHDHDHDQDQDEDQEEDQEKKSSARTFFQVDRVDDCVASNDVRRFVGTTVATPARLNELRYINELEEDRH